jgi:hypothetical protein
MRKFLMIAVAGLIALAGAGEVSAQVRIQTYVPKISKSAPKMKAPKPILKVIPPSVALNRAMMMAPDAKAIGIRLEGSVYVIKLKQGNKVKRVQVNAAP